MMRNQERRFGPEAASLLAVYVAVAALGASPVAAQSAQAAQPPPPAARASGIVVVAQRRSAVKEIEPIATFSSDAIAATGATSMSELLRIIRPLTQSANGEDPIFLLNGQRTSGYGEISALPPEAIDKVEVLPEPAALRYGYPPTRRVLNFITKRNFQQVEVRASVGTPTEGGGATSTTADLNITRLHKDSRFTLALESRHTSSLLQSRRDIVPDPDILFDGLGNVTGVDGGEIDPALSGAAGQLVTVAPVPRDEADRSSLSAYASAANQPRLFDLGPYRTLVPRNDAWKAESVFSDRLGGTLSGSINLSAEQSTDQRLSGPAAVTLTVPAGNPYSPFADTVLLQRYLTEVDPLHIRQTTTTLHGGGTLRGVTAGWRWDVTGNVDRKLVDATSERGIDVTAADAAIAAGADPFVPLDPALLSDRLTDRAHLLTLTMNTKLVVTNTPVHLPGGDVTVTGTAEADRLSANSVTRGANPFDLSLSRTQTAAGLALDVPLTSRREGFLAAVGDLSVNASGTARRVSGFGSLYDHTLGLTWSPIKAVQLLVQDKSSAAAPAMDKLASPITQVANVPVFDYGTGHTEIVTLTQGGNPNLAAEHRHVRSVGVNVKPFPGSDIRVSATYDDTEIRDQTGDIYAVIPQIEAIFPERFVRDSTGRLTAVTFEPTNFYRQHERTLHMTLAANGKVGRKPASAETDSGKSDDNRPYYYAGAGPAVRFSDELQLRPGTPVLDLLHGDTVSGGGTPRVTSYFYAGIGYLGNGLSIDGWYQASDRVTAGDAPGDLVFSSLFKLNVGAFISVHHFLRRQDWTQHMQLRLDVANLTDAREHVRDGLGEVPNRFQAELLDPLGRTVKLTLRKMI